MQNFIAISVSLKKCRRLPKRAAQARDVAYCYEFTRLAFTRVVFYFYILGWNVNISADYIKIKEFLLIDYFDLYISLKLKNAINHRNKITGFSYVSRLGFQIQILTLVIFICAYWYATWFVTCGQTYREKRYRLKSS